MATLLQIVWCLCVLRALAARLVVLGFPGSDGWEWMARVPDMDGAEFMEFASPLVQMSANAYRYPGTLHSIPGWKLSSRIAPLHPSHGGTHALVFEEHRSSGISGLAEDEYADPGWRVIIAFRGTQLSGSIDSLADLCADKLLWDGLDFTSLPAECLCFNPNTLDYFSQALDYTLQVIKLYPSVPTLLTGHSLGAGLAVLVAGALSHKFTLPVIGFGPPATKTPLLVRGIFDESLQNGRVIMIGHEWDVIMRAHMEGQVGLLCFYPQTEPPSCKSCIPSSWSPHVAEQEAYAKVHEKPDVLGGLLPDHCMDCFYATHYLKVLIGVINQGIEAVCQQAGNTSIAWSQP